MRRIGLASLMVLMVRVAPAAVAGGEPGSMSTVPGLDDEGNAAVLESDLADQRHHGTWEYIIRVRGAVLERDALNLYQRLVWQRDEHLETGILIQRDPGEPNWADFVALYIRGRSQRRKVDWVAGDLLPGWGQGLVCARSVGMGSLPLRLRASDSELMEYRSSRENRAIRGIAVRRQSGRWSWSLLAGRSARDGRLNAAGEVVTLPESGYHVTATERAGRKLLSLDVAATRLRYDTGRRVLGISLMRTRFSKPVDLRRPERRPWGFHGDSQALTAVDYSIWIRRLLLQGETAIAGSGHKAAVMEARLRWGGFRWRTVVRCYDPGFKSFFGGAPSRSGMENEQGIMVVMARRRWEVFADHYRRPERTYTYPYPATVQSAGGAVRTRWFQTYRGVLQGRLDRRPYWRTQQVVFHHSRRLRLDLEHSRSRGRQGLTRFRLEGRCLQFRPGTTDLGYSASLLWRKHWRENRVIVQLSRFDTPGYHSAIYEYEYDLPGLVTVRPLFGAGWMVSSTIRLGRGPVRLSGRYRWERKDSVRQYFGLQLDLQTAG